jgi:hypothetical protein
MIYFAPAVNAQVAITAAVILQTVLHTPLTKPLYFAACIATGIPIQHKIVIIHHLFEVSLAPGEESEHQGLVYAFQGDMIGRQLPIIIQIPADGFGITTQLNRPLNLITPNALNTRLLADINVGSLRVEATDAELRTARCRRLCFLPSTIAALMLGKNLSPRRAFEIVHAAVEERGIAQECEPMLNWFVASCITGANHIPYTASPPFVRPTPDEDLYKAALTIIDHELPGLNAPEPGPATMAAAPPAPPMADLRHLAQSVIAATDAMSNIALTNRPAVKTAKTPRSHFGSALDQVMRLCLVESEQHLPALLWEVADVTRTQHMGVIRNRLSATAHQMQMASPLVTKSVADVITGPHFACPDRGILTQGLSPFLFLPRNATDRAVYDKAMNTYRDLVENGNVNASDAAKMDALDTAPIQIRTYSQMKQVLGDFHVFLHTLFAPRSNLVDLDEDQDPRGGAPHPLLAAWDLFWRQVQVQEPMLIDACEAPGVPFGMVRWIQVRTALYAHNQCASQEQVRVPRFMELLDDIAVSRHWMPDVQPAHRNFGGVVSTAGTPAPATAPSNTAAPARNAARAPGNTSNNRGAEVVNPSPHDDFASFNSVTRLLKEILDESAAAGARLPFTKHTPAITYCLSWHLRKKCNDTCNRKADHITHTTVDRKALKDWCTQHFH